MAIQRQTAYKCRISDLVNGEYVKREGWEPNVLKSGGREISRANIIAVVISKESSNSITVDDGTGQVSVREFEGARLEKVEVGDVLLMIGRPRVYNDQIYLLAEIVKKVEDRKWVDYRMKEMDFLGVEAPEPGKKVKAEKPGGFVNYNDKVIGIVKRLDSGPGARVDEIVKESGLDNCEEIIDELVKEGEIFEIKPGHVKVLE